MGVIYKVTNKQDGKVYIGATTTTIKQRQLDHTQRAVKGEDTKFYNAMATQGLNNFKWEQIDTASTKDELAQKEKAYIVKYDSLENGYNSDVGGGIQKTVYQFDTNGKLINKYSSLDCAANAVSAVKSCIGSACVGVNHTCKGYYWSYNDTLIPTTDKRKKKVLQVDLNTFNVVGEYTSVAEASRRTGVSKTCISRCCRGERKSSSGYYWYYTK